MWLLVEELIMLPSLPMVFLNKPAAVPKLEPC
jgi:hypothetical protein